MAWTLVPSSSITIGFSSITRRKWTTRGAWVVCCSCAMTSGGAGRSTCTCSSSAASVAAAAARAGADIVIATLGPNAITALAPRKNRLFMPLVLIARLLALLRGPVRTGPVGKWSRGGDEALLCCGANRNRSRLPPASEPRIVFAPAQRSRRDRRLNALPTRRTSSSARLSGDQDVEHDQSPGPSRRHAGPHWQQRPCRRLHGRNEEQGPGRRHGFRAGSHRGRGRRHRHLHCHRQVSQRGNRSRA